MANTYKNAMFDLTNTNATTVYTVPTNATSIVKAIQTTNIHSGAIDVTVFTVDSSDSNAEFEVALVNLASKTVENLVKSSMVLESGDAIKIQAATADKIAGIVSVLEITRE